MVNATTTLPPVDLHAQYLSFRADVNDDARGVERLARG